MDTANNDGGLGGTKGVVSCRRSDEVSGGGVRLEGEPVAPPIRLQRHSFRAFQSPDLSLVVEQPSSTQREATSQKRRHGDGSEFGRHLC